MSPIPVSVLTGFLGSGKTTLLGRLLASPAFARTAVIINEFGEVGLDHDLIETSEESFVTLQTGCLCCRVRDDLVLTLEDLLRQRAAGAVPAFERIVIETSGLADPAPILHALMTDKGLAGLLTVAGVVTTVDAVNGAGTLTQFPEAIKQVAVADRVVLTKTDLADAAKGELAARVAAINPAAALVTARFGVTDAQDLLGDRDAGTEIGRWVPAERAAGGSEPAHAHHDGGIGCFALVREKPIPAIVLTLLLEVLAEQCGGDLLRLKGIVNIAESPERPAVIHGVQHVFHPPAWLDRWPSADRCSRFVFIGRNLHRAWVEVLLEALEAEVAEVAAAKATA